MRYVGYAWRVLLGLVEVTVVLALLNATNTKFETMVMGGLIVIYTAIVASFQLLGRSVLHVSHKQLEFFVSLGTLLKHPNLEFQSEALKEEAEDIQKMQGALWIGAVKNWLIGLVGTLALLVAAFKS